VNGSTVRLVNGYADTCPAGDDNGEVPGPACDGDPYQEWVTTDADNSPVVLRDGRTGQCLDSNADPALYASACDGRTSRRWT
jgi:hypothetical protein